MTNTMTATHPETIMSSRSRPSTESTLLPTSEPDLDLDESPDIPPDEPTAPPVAEPEPDPTPPAWMESQAQRVGADLALYPMNRLPTLRWNAIRAACEPCPLLDVPAAAIRAAYRGGAPLALNFINVGQAEVNAVYAWLDAVADEVVERRAAQLVSAREKERIEASAERDRLYRIEHAEELARAAEREAYASKQADYQAWLASQPQPVQPVA
jgi:hypothetical protein